MNLRKNLRKESAIKRQTEYSKLSTNQKIILLDMRLGKGIGAVKQRAKLAKVVELTKEITSTEKSEKKPYQKPKKS